MDYELSFVNGSFDFRIFDALGDRLHLRSYNKCKVQKSMICSYLPTHPHQLQNIPSQIPNLPVHANVSKLLPSADNRERSEV